jgi:hypothetical protein
VAENFRASSSTSFHHRVGRLLETGADRVEQTRVAELFVVWSGNFEDSVGEKQQRITGERAFLGVVFELSAQSQGRAGLRAVVAQSFDKAGATPQMQRPRMTHTNRRQDSSP